MSKIALEPNAAGTGTFSIASPATNTNRTLTLPDETGTVLTSVSAIPAAQITGLTSTNPLTLGTAVASTSGTAIDFTGIPSWAKRITVMLDGVSTNGISRIRFQLGDSGGIETTGYKSMAFSYQNSGTRASSTDGFDGRAVDAGYARHGQLIFSLLNSNVWAVTGSYWSEYIPSEPYFDLFVSITGSKTLSGTLDRVRITTVNGTDTFDAGTINISYEG
jgi:hypothetical protein